MKKPGFKQQEKPGFGEKIELFNIDETYKQELEEILAELKELGKSEKETKDKLKLAGVRAELG